MSEAAAAAGTGLYSLVWHTWKHEYSIQHNNKGNAGPW